jgi:hypothetical protein
MPDRAAGYAVIEADFRQVRPDPGTPDHDRYMNRLEDLWYSMTPEERKRAIGKGDGR